jgi:hypothetical protein
MARQVYTTTIPTELVPCNITMRGHCTQLQGTSEGCQALGQGGLPPK